MYNARYSVFSFVTNIQEVEICIESMKVIMELWIEIGNAPVTHLVLWMFMDVLIS